MGDESELRKLEVSALQEQLKAKNLSSVGDKDQLVFRLQQSQVKPKAEPKAAPPVPKDGKGRKGKGKGKDKGKDKGKGKGKDGKGKGKGWPADAWMQAAFGKGKVKGMGKGAPMPKMKALALKHKQVLMKASAKAPGKSMGKGDATPHSKAPAMLGASAKAGSKSMGATARRFMVNRIYSKAGAVARSSDVQMFAGKAFPAAPWRTNPQPVPKKKAAKKDEEEDEDYDPFAEEPAPHVAMEKVFRKAARRAAAASGENVEWRPKGTAVRPPWNKKALANGAAPKKKVGSVMPKTAAGWLKRPGGGSSRMNRGAALAEEYFQKTEAPAAKKQKVESATGRGFVQELLDKAPKELQTCRSLLVFLDKKLEAAVPEKPAVGGPQALKARLEAHAEGVGRLAGLRAPGGWDARAKRVLDITAAAATTAGEAALKALEELLEKESKDLDAKLKDTGDSLEAVTKERQAWAKDTLRRNWLAWCAKLLKAREVKLLADVEGEKVFDDQYLMTSVDVLEAVLAGTTA